MTEMTMELEKTETETPVGIERTRTGRTYVPRVDIYESGDNVVLLVDMPGVDEEGVDITLEKNMLTIRGHVEEVSPECFEVILSEYYIGDYERVFTLSDEVDRDKIDATIKQGVLRLTLTKSETAKTRKISVRTES